MQTQPRIQLGQYPPPTHTIAHLSDPHLLATAKQYGVIDTEQHLIAMLDRLRAVRPAPQALVFTGDLADLGEPEAYVRLRALVEPFAAELGAQVIWTMGNHDERGAYARALFDSEDDGPQDRVHDIDGLRIVALDTSVPGYHHGELTDDQLTWLRDLLATPAEHGTLLAMHHPPLPLPLIPGADLIDLRDQDRLAAAIEGSDVRGIIAGHLHCTTWSTFAGVPVSVAAASCYTVDPAPEGSFLSSVDANQSFTMLHTYADRLVHTLVPVERGPEVASLGLDVAEAMTSMPLDQLRDLASRKDSPFNTQHEVHD